VKTGGISVLLEELSTYEECLCVVEIDGSLLS
jgi:hypothetical protein